MGIPHEMRFAHFVGDTHFCYVFQRRALVIFQENNGRKNGHLLVFFSIPMPWGYHKVFVK